jgi:hypothetical protein
MRVHVRALAYNEACDLWKKKGILVETLPINIKASMILNALRHPSVGLLLTGTSVNSVELEKQFVAAAREVGVPSLAVLDFWSNYSARFSNSNGELVYLPEQVAIMDDDARREMAEEGIDSSRLVVTGHPAFDDLASCRLRFTVAKRAKIREGLGIEPNGLAVLFASQPIAEVYGPDAANPRFLGYDEVKVAKALIRALEGIAVRAARPITLVIRPHPRENLDSLCHYRSDVIRILVSTEGSSRDLAMAVDLVSGMNTNLLVEACYLGCLVVSLQPGLRGRDVLPTNRSGLSQPIYHRDEFEPIIEKILLEKEVRAARLSRVAGFEFEGGAAERVADLAYRMIESRT